MNKFICTIFVILFFSSPALAQTKITDLSKDDVAPFSGLLLSPEAFAELEVGAKYNTAKIKLEVDRQLKLKTLELQTDIKLLTIEIESLTTIHSKELSAKDIDIQYWRDLYEEENDESFFERNDDKIGFLLGVLITVAILLTADSLDDNFIDGM